MVAHQSLPFPSTLHQFLLVVTLIKFLSWNSSWVLFNTSFCDMTKLVIHFTGKWIGFGILRFRTIPIPDRVCRLICPTSWHWFRRIRTTVGQKPCTLSKKDRRVQPLRRFYACSIAFLLGIDPSPRQRVEVSQQHLPQTSHQRHSHATDLLAPSSLQWQPDNLCDTQGFGAIDTTSRNERFRMFQLNVEPDHCFQLKPVLTCY